MEAVRDEFIQLWSQMGSFWGIAPGTARVYAWLLSLPEPADAEEIRDGLSMSRGAVSMACRELRDWGLVAPERAPGSRRVSYRPETDLERAIKSIIRMRKRREWDPILDRLREWIPTLRSDRSREARMFRERLEAIEAMVGLADSMADDFLKGGMVQRFGLKVLVAKANRAQAGRRAGP